jgi:Mg2+-importing ATPase
VRALDALGVQVKVLSGDEPRVTASVCNAIGLEIAGGKPVTGAELAAMGAQEFSRAALEANVFARITPSQKLAIVDALKARGHIVGFIGDGVNDAPALKAADAGIAVDTGADIAKEAADIILLKHGLSPVADGIAEGRKTFANTMKYVRNTISANFGNMFTVSLSSLFLSFLPMLPSQILLNNFLSDLPLMTVSTDRVDARDLKKPSRWSIAGITRFMVAFGLISSLFDVLTMAFLIYGLNATESLFRSGWFVESVLSEIAIVFALRTRLPFYASRPSNLLIATSAIVAAASVAAVYWPPTAQAFEFAPMPPDFLAAILAVIAAYFVVVEACKHAYFRLFP